MSNLPDDWSAYWTTCEDCGARYHLSGVYECACDACGRCGERIPPDTEMCGRCEELSPIDDTGAPGERTPRREVAP